MPSRAGASCSQPLAWSSPEPEVLFGVAGSWEPLSRELQCVNLPAAGTSLVKGIRWGLKGFDSTERNFSKAKVFENNVKALEVLFAGRSSTAALSCLLLDFIA